MPISDSPHTIKLCDLKNRHEFIWIFDGFLGKGQLVLVGAKNTCALQKVHSHGVEAYTLMKYTANRSISNNG